MNKSILKSFVILTATLSLATGATGSYFSDQVTVSGNEFSTGTWGNVVINEVYYDTGIRTYLHGNGVKTEEEGKNEWIELYNPNSFEVNIKDWSVTDNSGTAYKINPNVSIPANGFVLLSHDNDTWHFWGDPAVTTVNLGGSLSSGWLNNNGDRLVLRDKDNNIVDQISYGSDNGILNPSIIDVAEGHSIERNPIGKDTDTQSDFVERTNPTPGT